MGVNAVRRDPSEVPPIEFASISDRHDRNICTVRPCMSSDDPNIRTVEMSGTDRISGRVVQVKFATTLDNIHKFGDALSEMG